MCRNIVGVLHVILLGLYCVSCVSAPKRRGENTFVFGGIDKEFIVKEKLDSVSDIISGNAILYDANLEGVYLPSGELLFHNRFSAAHASFPYETMLWVFNPKQNRQLELKINDKLSKQKSKEGIILQVTQRVATSLGIKKGQDKFFVKFSLKQFENIPIVEGPEVIEKPVIVEKKSSNFDKQVNKSKKNRIFSEESLLNKEQNNFLYKFLSDKPKSGDYFVQLGAFSTLKRAQTFLGENTNTYTHLLYIAKKRDLHVVVVLFKNREISYDFFDRLKELDIDVLAPQIVP